MKGLYMTAKVSERLTISPEDVDPRHDWKRPLRAPGVMNVDFEERVDFRRLHRYRLRRARPAPPAPELGALLVLEKHNIRYLPGTATGEWARDKMCRFAVLAGDGEPHLWDFVTDAAPTGIYAPWLQPICCHAGMVGLRGTVPPDAGLIKRAALEIKAVLGKNGVSDVPLGIDVVEPPMLFELQRLGIEVRDGQQTLLDAREIKSPDEIMLLNTAASMVGGAYHIIHEKPKPGGRESDIVARDNHMLYSMGSDAVEAVNAVASERR